VTAGRTFVADARGAAALIAGIARVEGIAVFVVLESLVRSAFRLVRLVLRAYPATQEPDGEKPGDNPEKK
jgi:hypothetical protein